MSLSTTYTEAGKTHLGSYPTLTRFPQASRFVDGSTLKADDTGTYYKVSGLAWVAVVPTNTIAGDLTVTGDTTESIVGNASTATALATPRAINGVNFDGSAAITVTADANTLSGTTLKSTVLASSLTSVGTLAGVTVTLGDHVDDAAAATATVPVGGLYHTSGAVKVRVA